MGTGNSDLLGRMEPGVRRVRAYLGGKLVTDTTTPSLVWENSYYPTYYLPVADVRAELVEDGPGLDGGTVYTVRVDGAEAPGAALRHVDSPIAELRDPVRLD